MQGIYTSLILLKQSVFKFKKLIDLKIFPLKLFKNSCDLQNVKLMNRKSKRETCPDCWKPLYLCVCIRLKTRNLDNIHVTILQHCFEKLHPLNSATIARLALKNVRLFNVTDVNFEALFQFTPLGRTPRVRGNAPESLESRKRDFDKVNTRICEPFMSVTIGKKGIITRVSLLDDSKTHEIERLVDSREAVEYLAGGFKVKKLQKKEISGGSGELEEFEIIVPPGTALLFPSHNAVAVDAVDFKVKNLILLDGTWLQAKRMYLENPWLGILPCVRLDVKKMSLFGEVRRQRKRGYLSTIESIVYALEALGETDNLSGLHNLLDVFESMVEDQRRFKAQKSESVFKMKHNQRTISDDHNCN